MADVVFAVEFRNDGTAKVIRDLDAIGRSGDKAASSLEVLKGLVASYIGVRAVREVMDLANAYGDMLNKLRTVTSGQYELNTAVSDTFSISQETRTSLEATTALYQRLSLNLDYLNVTQKQTADFTRQLNYAVVLSGATSREASWGIIQLAQGMAMGSLQSRDLRSVMEQLPIVADVIAKHMGVTRGELRELGSQGKITPEIIMEAFSKADDDLKNRFGKTVPTVSQSVTVLQNSVLSFWGNISQNTGVVVAFSGAMRLAADNMGILGPAALALGVAFSVLTIRVVALRIALTALKAANPYWLLASAVVGFGTAAVAMHRNATAETRNNIQANTDLAESVGRTIDTLKAQNGITEQQIKLYKERYEALTKKPPTEIQKPTGPVSGFTPLSKSDLQPNIGINLKSVVDPANVSIDVMVKKTQDLAEASHSLKPFSTTIADPSNVGALTLTTKAVEADTRAIRYNATAMKELKDEVDKAKVAEFQFTQTQKDLLYKIQGKPVEDWKRDLHDLNVLYANGALTIQEYNLQLSRMIATASKNPATTAAMSPAMGATDFSSQQMSEGAKWRYNLQQNQDMLKDATDAQSGLKQGWNEVLLDATNYAETTKTLVVGAYRNMSDAVVEFTHTGKMNWKSMVDGILDELTRLLFKMIMVKTIGSAMNAISPGSGTALMASPRADGGSVSSGQPYLVGERGPELFVPGQSGNISSAKETAAVAKDGGVVIINVSSQEAALAAMRSNEGKRIIMNHKVS